MPVLPTLPPKTKTGSEACSHSVSGSERPETPSIVAPASRLDVSQTARSHGPANPAAFDDDDEAPSSPATSDLDSDLDARSFVVISRLPKSDFSRLSKTLKERIRVLKQLQEFFKLKASYEDSFARNMNKLVDSQFGQTESGPLAASLSTLMTETSKQATNHRQLAREIRYEFIPQLASMIQRCQTLLDEEILPAEVDADSGEAWDSLQVDTDRWERLNREMRDMESKRGDVLKDVLWAYANALSTACVSDDQSCESLRVALENFEPGCVAESEGDEDKVVGVKAPDIVEVSSNEQTEMDLNLASASASVDRNSAHSEPKRPLLCSCCQPPTSVSRDVHPTAVPPARAIPIPPPSQMFYVKALYDYVATSAEELSFKAGDVISVTATTEDGWWAGEHLDKSKRVIGKFLFPCNFVYRIPGLTEAVLTSTNPMASTSSSGSPVGATLVEGSNTPSVIQWPLSPLPTAVPEMNGMKPSRLLPQERSRVKFFVKTDFPFTGVDAPDLSFDAGDIIAVTATPGDGWWHGEPMNESKRLPGKYIFPSNFVHRL